MPTVNLSPLGGAASQFFDNNGVILTGGKLYTYAAGTTTPQITYASVSGATPHANPIILDSAGRVPGGQIWLTDGLVYKFVIETSTGVLLGTYDNISAVDAVSLSELAASTGATLIGTSNGETVQEVIDSIDGVLNFSDPVVYTLSVPTAAINATAGNLNGTYYYRVSYITATGETEVNQGTAAVSPVNQQVNLTNIPVSPDPRVTGRRIYRTTATSTDQVLGKLVTTINNNTTTTYTDNVADGSLGANAPYFNSTGGNLSINGAVVASIANITTRFGANANPSQSGYASTAFGANALRLNQNGYRITALGTDACELNTTGYEMTAVGVHALGSNTTARQSCAFGYGALENANANFNCAFGTKSQSSTTSGTTNSSFGTFSHQLSTTASSNCAFGYLTAYGITTGIGNSCYGAQSGQSIAGGNFNTFVGLQSGNVATGSGNVGVGATALSDTTTGADNAALGNGAGKSITTGSNNVFIGPNAGNNASQKVDAFRSIAIGLSAFTTKDNQIVIGTPSYSETMLFGVQRGSTFTVATLPSATTMGAGARAFVTDANATTFAAIVAAGGANGVPVYSDGTNWRIG